MLTVAILTKDEEKNIFDALESVRFADEIVIIDDNSQDRTREVVEALSDPRIKFFKRKLDDFASQRNYALKIATGDWVFFLDADERVPADLKAEIKNVTRKRSEENGFFIRRTDHIWGKELQYGETAHVRLLRLGKKGKGEWSGDVHEVWDITGKKGTLTHSIHHYPHTTIAEFIADINEYTQIRANELFETGETVSTFQIIAMPIGKFIQNYFLRLGYKDGVHGFVMAALMSFHSFLVRTKLWLLLQKN